MQYIFYVIQQKIKPIIITVILISITIVLGILLYIYDIIYIRSLIISIYSFILQVFLYYYYKNIFSEISENNKKSIEIDDTLFIYDSYIKINNLSNEYRSYKED